MIRQRQPLNMIVKSSAQIVRDPLADARGQIFFGVRTNRPENGNRGDRSKGKIQDGKLTVLVPVRNASRLCAYPYGRIRSK